jgi:hypothetical protein
MVDLMSQTRPQSSTKRGDRGTANRLALEDSYHSRLSAFIGSAREARVAGTQPSYQSDHHAPPHQAAQPDHLKLFLIRLVLAALPGPGSYRWKSKRLLAQPL